MQKHSKSMQLACNSSSREGSRLQQSLMSNVQGPLQRGKALKNLILGLYTSQNAII